MPLRLVVRTRDSHDFAGDLRSSLHSHRDVEAKLTHLADLRARMTAAYVDESMLAAAAEHGKATLAKARRKVLDQALGDRAITDAMSDTPRAHWSD